MDFFKAFGESQPLSRSVMSAVDNLSCHEPPPTAAQGSFMSGQEIWLLSFPTLPMLSKGLGIGYLRPHLCPSTFSALPVCGC